MNSTLIPEKFGIVPARKRHARIKIGISTYNDYEYLDMLLQSIRWYTYLDERYDVVVCDDGSTEDMRARVQGVCNKYGAIYIEHAENKGIPTTWNHLVTSLDDAAEIIVILNNDLLVVPHWLRVAVYFLDANKGSPHVGSCFWNPINNVPKDMMKAILSTLGTTTYYTKETVTGREPLAFGSGHSTEVLVGKNQGLGRVMCPCGPCFAVRREVFEQVNMFDERFTSFHEESHFGTQCAAVGRASFGFAYPRPYHTHGATFAVNPELESSKRMIESRKLYREIWNVPDNISITKYFDHVNERLMPQIPMVPLKYLRPDYDLPPIKIQQQGGEIIDVPALVEFEETF